MVNKKEKDKSSFIYNEPLIAKDDVKKMSRVELEKIAILARELQFERDCAIVELEETKKSLGLIEEKGDKPSCVYRPSITRLSPKYSISKLTIALEFLDRLTIKKL